MFIVKRIISVLLTAAMLVGLLPVLPVFAEEEAILLEVQKLEDVEYDEALSYVMMGTVQSEVEERGRYILTVFREGNTSVESVVDIKTADVSAKYGVDYIIDDDRYFTETAETESTLLELSGNEELVQEGEESFEELQAMVDSSADTEENADKPEATEDMFNIVETNDTGTDADIPGDMLNITGDSDGTFGDERVLSGQKEASDPQQATEEGKSSLAQLKEEQTGLATRPTYETDMEPVISTIMNDMGIVDIAEHIETSSTTQLVFAPGEAEKQIIIRILEDNESEGQEIINFMLSNPDENTELSEPTTTSIVINDDEPVVHSKVSFKSGEFEAQDGTVTVTVSRTEALYSYVTAMVRTVENGDAKAGSNYAETDTEIEFRPYQEETTVEIPVAADKDMSFGLELYDLKGGEDGEIMTAQANIKSSDNEETAVELADSPSQISIEGKTYKLDFSQNSQIGKIMDGNVQVGEYWVPVDGTFVYDGSSKAKKKAEYDSTEKCGHLHSSTYFYDWDLSGGLTRTFALHGTAMRKYQSFYLDCQTFSGSNNSEYGIVEENYQTINGYYMCGELARQVQGPVKSLTTDRKPFSQYSRDWINLMIYAMRKESGSAQPHIKFWGLIKMYRQFDVTVEQPEEMEYKTPEGKTQKLPAKVSVGEDNKATRYTNQALSINAKPVNEGELINGTLVGYNIWVGNNTNPFFYWTNSSTLTFDNEFIKRIDKYTNDIEETKLGFTTKIRIQPVYNYINVNINILPCEEGEDGKFSDYRLQSSSTNTFHVGDVISTYGTSNKPGYEWDSFYVEGYYNPGDTTPQDDAWGTLLGKELRLDYVKYNLRPNFSMHPNFIEVQMDEEAEKYFEVLNIVPQSELKNEHMIGKKVLDIQEKRTESDYNTAPVPGRAYTVQLTLKEGVTGYRPRITWAFTGDYVDGFAMDFIAKEKDSKNIIKVTAQPDDGSGYEDYFFSGVAKYTAMSVRQSSDVPTQGAAEGAVVTTGTSLHSVFDKNGNKILMPNRINTEANSDGEFDAVALQVKKGDRISVRVTNNDLDQVKYYVVSDSGKEPTAQHKTFTELQADDASGKNIYVTADRPLYPAASVPAIDMPIRTMYAPYILSVNYDYMNGHEDVDTRNNSIPIFDDGGGAMLKLTANVRENGGKVNRVEFIRYNKDGEKKQTYTAKKDSSGFYSVTVDPSAIFEGDKLYVRLVCDETVAVKDESGKETETVIEKNYALLNTGLSFYFEHTNSVAQHLEVNAGTIGELPILGDLAADLDTGKLSWSTTYADRENPGRSARAETFTVSVKVSDIKDDLEKLDAIKNGKSVTAQKSVEEQLEDFNPLDEATAQEKHQLATAYGIGEESVDEWSTRKREEKRAELQEKQKQDSYAKMSKKVDWDIKFNVLLQFEYAYNPEKNEHVFTGGQYIIGGAFNVKKTWYWLVYGVPVYLNVSGEISLQLDGRYTTKNGETILARQIKESENVLDKRFVSNNPWLQIGFGTKIQPGIGVCGILGARGVFKLDGITRFLFDSSVTDASKKRGAMVKMSGGVGIDLLLFSYDYTIGSLKFGWGIYDKGKASLSSADDEANITIRPLSRGNETDTIFGKDQLSLASSLEPVSKTDIVKGSMEYVRPEIISLGDGRLMMVYLKNDETRNDANAAALVYTIKDQNGVWSEPVYIDSDGTADGISDILCDGSKVYIAWGSADEAVMGNGEDINEVKKDLQKMNIRMRVYDIQTGEMGDVITVTRDEYLNSDVRLTKEDSNIALYYLKKDISNVSSAEQLVSTTSNYSTWAKKVFDPAANSFVVQSTETGEAEEKLIYIKHPTVQDPLVYDCAVEDFTYDNGTEDTSDDIKYSISSYSIDSDKNIETNSDREVWMQITDLTDGKEYYPLKVSSEDEDIINVKLTKVEGDVLLTWLSNTSTFNTISIKNLFDALRSETGDSEGKETGVTGLSLFRSLTKEEAADKDWSSILAEKAKDTLQDADKERFDELFPMTSDITNRELIRNAKDFSNGSDEQINMSDYRIVLGGDKNVYLFWTGPSLDSTNYGRELYGTSFFRVSDEWLETWGDDSTVKSGWGDPVQLTEYGEVIDEMTIAVDANKCAVIIANMFEQTIDDESGEVKQGEHSLVEIDCIPSNSLDIVDDEITLSNEYPAVGEETTISFVVKNDGLLPSTGQDVAIKVLQNGNVVFEDPVSETEDKDVIFVGNEFRYSTTWTPESLDGDIEIIAEVDEHNTETGVHTASKKLERKANIEFGESYTWTALEAITEAAKYADGYNSEEISAEAEALYGILGDESKNDFDYVVFLPVSNTGNAAMSDIKASAVHIDEDLNENGTLGESGTISLDAKQSGLIAIPVKAGEGNYTNYGVLEMMLKVNSGETNLDADKLHETVYESGNVGVVANDGIGTIQMQQDETFNIEARAYPFDSIKNMYYYSDNPEVASVSEDGVVTASGGGKTIVYALDLSSGMSDEIEVTVEGTEPTPTPRRNHGSGSSSYSTNTDSATATPIPASSQSPEPTSAPSGGNDGWFVDVPESAWYYESVKQIFEMGLMVGTDDTHFEPETDVTRGMFATTLYRMENEPETALEYTFKDVPVNEYYAKPVAWASSNGIVTGYSAEEYGPDDTITREQMSAMIYRYAQYKGAGFTGTWAFPLSYADSADVSDYAYEAMCWNTMNGIINGVGDNKLDPKANSTRAEIAAVLVRLSEVLSDF